jgi:hypothetical protein
VKLCWREPIAPGCHHKPMAFSYRQQRCKSPAKEPPCISIEGRPEFRDGRNRICGETRPVCAMVRSHSLDWLPGIGLFKSRLCNLLSLS